MMSAAGFLSSRRLAVLAAALFPVLATATPLQARQQQEQQCEGTNFNPISAADFVAAMNPGWNLGNTLDAIPNEGSWNNPPVTASVFDDVKAAGFKSVRIPVTYTHHYTGGSPDWTVDPAWLQRVEDVVDMALDRGFYVITNIHHDSWEWADISLPTSNVTQINEKIRATWLQVGRKLACKSSRLAFETINEPPATTAEDGERVNVFNDIFVEALAETGGFNKQRVVTLVGGGMDSVKTTDWFRPPKVEFENPWALQYHYYSPYDFIFSAWGKTILTEADLTTIAADITNIRTAFPSIPLVLGEFSASPTNNEPAARRKWTDLVVRTAAQQNTAVILWDNGLDQLDRQQHVWRDAHQIRVLVQAARQGVNTLADFTMDGTATSQKSSAYVFHRVGEDVAGSQSVSFDTVGSGSGKVNQIKAIALDGNSAPGPKKLLQGPDYTLQQTSTGKQTVTFTKPFLGRFFSKTAAPGIKASLTVTFAEGATAGIELVQWATPKLGRASSKAVAGSGDLSIPVTWAGLRQPAAVKMRRSDGVYLFDDWTQWLGPLQVGRGTYSNQWNWAGDNIVLTAATVDAVAAAGLETVFTIDFYPRGPGNSVNYTLTV